MVQITMLSPGDEKVLENVAPDVFDNPVRPEIAAEFLSDPRHHMAVAIDEGVVVGMASGVHYIHPDKPPELWINEVGVAPTHWKQGLAKRLVEALLDTGRSLGCREAWVLTDRDNPAALRLYASVGGTETKGETVMFEFRIEPADGSNGSDACTA